MPNPMHLKSQEAEAVLTMSNRPEYEGVEEYLLRRRKLLLEKLATCQDSTILRVLPGGRKYEASIRMWSKFRPARTLKAGLHDKRQMFRN